MPIINGMQSARKPLNEKQRLEALQSLNILDTLPERDFDQITFLASQICGTPIALISLIDEHRQWFKSKVGVAASETPRDLAFCAHAILGEDILVVSDPSKDERFFDNPLVTGGPLVQFYAGAPLMSPDGFALGTVCVIDSKPRTLASEQIEALKVLSEQVTRLLQLRSQVLALQKTEESLRFKNTAIETIFEGITLQDAKGTIVDFNPAAASLLNMTEDQLLGKTSLDSSWRAIKEDGSDFPGNEHPSMVCLRTGLPQRNVVMGVRNSGFQARWIKINAAPLFGSSGKKPTHTVVSFADITEEVRIKKLLEKKSADLRFILDGIPDMVGLWGADEINLNSNSAYSGYFKLSPTQIRGCHLKELLGEEIYKNNEPFIRRVLAGEKVTFERKLSHTEGDRDTLASYIPNFEGDKVVSFLALVTDITEFKKLERDQRKLEVRLAESAKLTALGEMAAGVAHEVNNPLAIIRGKAEILMRKASQNNLNLESAIKDLKSIELTVDRIARIVKALRVYSRNADSDKTEVTSLSEILNDTLELCRERFNNAKVEVRVQCDPSLKVNCRATEISQVVMNLLMNSFDAISNLKNKWIEIKGLEKDEVIQLQVTDSGSGIPQAVVEKMMNPFFTTKEVGKGTGLGLSISTGIVESHGGTLKYVQGSVNTSFIISLPKFHEPSAVKAA